MGAGSTTFYIGMVLDVEDYYLEPTEEPGRWHGDYAAELGRSGRVERADLETILEGRDPRTGAKIATWRKRPAYDLTLSATKSVSLLWGLGDADVAAVVEQSHDRAVDAAFAYMNEQACKVRRGAGGKWDLPAHGLLGAIFRHRTSRDLDPDLHSHVLVANVTRGADDEYSCPDGNLLFDHARAAGCIYQAVLRRQLREQLGVRFGEVTKGYAEIVGIDRDMRRAFSKRRVAIEARMAEHGTKSRRGAEIAALATRKAKGDPLSEAQLRAAWEADAAELGLEVSDSLGRPGPVTAEVVTDQALGHVLTEKHATFERRRIVEAVASSSRTGMTVAEIEARIDEFMASDTCVLLPTGRYSTPEMIALEREALHIATDSPPRRPVTSEAVDAAVRARPSLSPEQRAAVRSITGGAAVSCVVGYAGAGKTFALDAAREAWHASGMDTVGCSLSARAGRQLQTSSGIESDTADRLLGDLDTGRRRLTDRSVIVIDETSMLGSRRLVRLMRHTAQARAKMVLVGDPKQLPEIDAGGLFTVLARRLGCNELTENRRQRRPTERTTARAMRDGEVERALLLMGRTGRVTTPTATPTSSAARWPRTGIANTPPAPTLSCSPCTAATSPTSTAEPEHGASPPVSSVRPSSRSVMTSSPSATGS